MDNNLLDFTVTRAIPDDILEGLAAGIYKLYGGVIRWAPGTKKRGAIVRHLIPTNSQTITDPLFNNISRVVNSAFTYKLNSIGLTTQAVLNMSTATMALSGLNLAVTAVGFAVITQKMKKLENQLNRIEKEVKGIKELLELEERARLGAALEDLLNAMKSQKPDDRRDLLFHAKGEIAPIRLKYKEMLTKANELEVILGNEEYFVLTSLAHTRCLSELGMLDTARRTLEEDVIFWRDTSKKIALNLLGDDPERFLFSEFVEDVTVSDLIEWMDFAHGEEKGYEQLDNLRAMTPSWYVEVVGKEVGKKTNQRGSITKQISSFVSLFSGKKDNELDWQLKKIVPTLQKLVARNSIFDGYIEQYKYLEEHNILPSVFQSELAKISSELYVDGYLILEPKIN